MYSTGTDVAGEVVAVGPGVDTFTSGDKVLSWIDLRVNSDLYTIKKILCACLLMLYHMKGNILKEFLFACSFR